jgi:hypothetical protein
MLRLLKILMQARFSGLQVLARVDRVLVTLASSDLPSFNLKCYVVDSGLTGIKFLIKLLDCGVDELR